MTNKGTTNQEFWNNTIEHMSATEKEFVLNKLRPEGRWVKVGEAWQRDDEYHPRYGWECSICGHVVVQNEEEIKGQHFCSDCGADMRGDSE